MINSLFLPVGCKRKDLKGGRRDQRGKWERRNTGLCWTTCGLGSCWMLVSVLLNFLSQVEPGLLQRSGGREEKHNRRQGGMQESSHGQLSSPLLLGGPSSCPELLAAHCATSLLTSPVGKIPFLLVDCPVVPHRILSSQYQLHRHLVVQQIRSTKALI